MFSFQTSWSNWISRLTSGHHLNETWEAATSWVNTSHLDLMRDLSPKSGGRDSAVCSHKSDEHEHNQVSGHVLKRTMPASTPPLSDTDTTGVLHPQSTCQHKSEAALVSWLTEVLHSHCSLGSSTWTWWPFDPSYLVYVAAHLLKLHSFIVLATWQQQSCENSRGLLSC